MAQQDLAQIRADEAWVTTWKTLLQAVIDHMEDKAVPLTTEQKRKFKTFAEESTVMVTNGVALVRDNPGWFPSTFNRAELLLDMADRDLWLQGKTLVMKINELFEDTLHAVGSDIFRGVTNARPFIEQSAELTGSGNDQVNEFLDYYSRFGPGSEPTPTPPPPTPPTP